MQLLEHWEKSNQRSSTEQILSFYIVHSLDIELVSFTLWNETTRSINILPVHGARGWWYTLWCMCEFPGPTGVHLLFWRCKNILKFYSLWTADFVLKW